MLNPISISTTCQVIQKNLHFLSFLSLLEPFTLIKLNHFSFIYVGWRNILDLPQNSLTFNMFDILLNCLYQNEREELNNTFDVIAFSNHKRTSKPGYLLLDTLIQFNILSHPKFKCVE